MDGWQIQLIYELLSEGGQYLIVKVSIVRFVGSLACTCKPNNCKHLELPNYDIELVKFKFVIYLTDIYAVSCIIYKEH